MTDSKSIAMPRTLPVLLALIMATLVAGCGEVIVFGHVVREGKPSTADAQGDSSAKPAGNDGAGQTQGAASGKESTAATPKVSAAQRHATVVRSVTLAFTPEVATTTSDDARFNPDALLAAIRSELQARKLLDDANVDAGAAVVSIDDYSMRRTSNVILFGNINSVGTLKGIVRIQDAQGQPLAALPVSAESHISIPAEGETPNPLEPLYRDFAVAAAGALVGKATSN